MVSNSGLSEVVASAVMASLLKYVSTNCRYLAKTSSVSSAGVSATGSSVTGSSTGVSVSMIENVV